MRPPVPERRPVALTVAGSDSGGGAGVQADVRTMAARGTFPTSALTSVTAQHTRGVERSITLPVEDVKAQLDAVRSDFELGAAKTGMLATEVIVERVTEWVTDAECPLVVDPVMVATSGDRLLERGGERAYHDLVAEATVVTPNHDEATVLTDVDVVDGDTAREAAVALRELGADAALVTDGHGDGETVTDVLVTADGVQELSRPRIETGATHGSGCVLSAAIAAELAHGRDPEAAVERATDFVSRAVAHPHDVGEGPGAVNPLVDLCDEAARERTAETVRSIVAELVARDPADLVPEVGVQVVGATPAADSPNDCAAVDGRLSRTLSGIEPTGEVRFGASNHVARALLSARAFDPRLRFAANALLDGTTRSRLDALDGPVASFDRSDEPADASSMDWGVRTAFERASERPVAVFDEGAVGKEPMVRVFASGPGTLLDRLGTLAGG